MALLRFTPLAVTGCKEAAMFELILGAIVAVGLAAYLVTTLLYPEKF